ncbi:MAG TPA: acyltransferase [Pyrinomonadaceae bacterium]|jgi:acetyltransferase-like isoleucine patch superfamily enzyme
MRRLLATLWNGLLDAIGGLCGAIVRAGVRGGWLYFPYVSEFLSRLPFSPGWKLRRAVYARVLPRIGRDVLLNYGVVIEDPRTTFGDDVWISVGSYIDYAEIGSHVLVGQHVVMLSGRHHHRIDRLDVPIKQQGNPPKEPITIGDGAWLGANATVMANVGQHAIVGAGSVVTKPVPDYAVVAGNPARIIRDRRQAATTTALAGTPALPASPNSTRRNQASDASLPTS